MTAVCAICGDRIAPDEEIVIGEWRVTQKGVTRGDQSFRLRPQHKRALWMLAKNKGRYIPPAELGLRIAKNPEECLAPDKLAGQAISWLRCVIPGVPIETVYGEGYRWAA